MSDFLDSVFTAVWSGRGSISDAVRSQAAVQAMTGKMSNSDAISMYRIPNSELQAALLDIGMTLPRDFLTSEAKNGSGWLAHQYQLLPQMDASLWKSVLADEEPAT